jgi:DNA-binding GntR family transcriptional regulator
MFGAPRARHASPRSASVSAMSSDQYEQVQVSEGLGRDLVGLIRSLILSGEYSQGDKLLPRELQERFGVSHIPVREAVRALEAEGLVVMSPRRTPRVATMTLGELYEVYHLRRLIEPDVAGRAAAARNVHDIERAVSAHTDLGRLVDSAQQDVEAIMAAHREFHARLLAPAIQDVTRRTVENLWTIANRYVRMTMVAFRAERLAIHDHRALLDAFITGDEMKSRTETDHHLELVERTTVERVGSLLDLA